MFGEFMKIIKAAKDGAEIGRNVAADNYAKANLDNYKRSLKGRHVNQLPAYIRNNLPPTEAGLDRLVLAYLKDCYLKGHAPE